MFEISELKAKKLTDLQSIAKTIGLTRISQLKKLDLVYKILDAQAEVVNNKKEEKKPAEKKVSKVVDANDNKPRRRRISKKENETSAKFDVKLKSILVVDDKSS